MPKESEINELKIIGDMGGAGNDTYLFERTFERDVIRENDATLGNFDAVQFGTSIASQQLWFTRSGSDLAINVIGSSDTLAIENWYGGSQYQVEQFNAGDGKRLTNVQVDTLVQAMAAFAPPPVGQTALGASTQSALANVFAANWK